MDAQNALAGLSLVPVIEIDRSESAVPLAQLLFDCGIQAMEITLRTPAALPAINLVAENVPGMLVGAGSIRTAQDVQKARFAGAQFLVSPGCSSSILNAVEYVKLPFVPGAASASEILELAERGYNLVKFFPAELLGGVAMLKALSAPLPETRFFPTGGINGVLALDYLALKNVVCVRGSWFVPSAALKVSDFGAIEKLARATAQASQRQ